MWDELENVIEDPGILCLFLGFHNDVRNGKNSYRKFKKKEVLRQRS
jgi:hypothetical protein